VQSQPISKRITMALAACAQACRSAEPPLQSDLNILGKLLIPEALAKSLSSDTHLLIAPHRGLHQVPWSALQPSFTPQPLVNTCIPSIIPSLQGLAILWKRNGSRHITERKNGLMIGLSSFNGLRPELPFVRAEIAALASKLDSGGRVFAEQDATWENLLHLKSEQASHQTMSGMANFGWLHIASHFFSDRHTGRVSGIAFSDGDIWLDQLRDIAPLPALISLSACNSNDSFLYAGDERMDLQSTCLIAGANTVIGSAWPIQDQMAAELMLLFYDHYLSGQTPARAAALAQRRFIEAGKDLTGWASFICAGMP
jgi:CHAT domain-containing protein